ncbi:hypothetical protein HCH_00668 [Hahella chejuensis KCTC 2396]|uniref:Uncharacterized protein n=1 Tax=Hahella chejuensis (strain KCTC 2396) TaxID=349521 RepID=Q2SP56_HAHCH|nr:hypothetical protein [Hahella chejuensis]ABC27568.1 hypothetical protein HCH_00668 [Hahella chejuensis KCTC 2396]
MPTLVQAIFGRGQAKLKRLLKDYPPYQAPHSQEPFSLTIEQAYANLNYLIAEKANRLVIYGELLRKFGLDLDEGLHNASPEPFLPDLHAWAYKHWPEVYEPASGAQRYMVELQAGRRSHCFLHADGHRPRPG